ncbi:MAG: PAS domain S-box protein [Spirochaetia bacterium]|nr:PAS domain S-box protein [Spirochaetia bacterium]
MNSVKPVYTDERLKNILDFLNDLEIGIFNNKLIPSEKNDDIDLIIKKINKISNKKAGLIWEKPYVENRLSELVNVIINISSLNFSKKANISDDLNIFDTIAQGLNILGEELLASTVSREYLNNIVQSMTDILFVLNEKKEIQTINDIALEILGYKDEELHGQNINILFFGELPSVLDFQNKKENSFTQKIETSLKSKYGKEVPVIFSSSIMSEKDGSFKGIVCIASDITERKKTEQALFEREEKIKKSLKEKEILLKEIHHRVKNNLQVIMSLLYLQSINIKDKNTLALFQDSQNRIKSMALVHEQLYRSKNLADIDMSIYYKELIKQIYKTYAVTSNDITVETDIKNVFLGINIAVPCGLIANELISNAFKHAFEKENKENKIMIKMRKEAKNFELIVKDNGKGIPENIDIYKSDTLGMTLVNTLVTQIEGSLQISVENGSLFKIIF